jgi:hypothetical protein
MDTAALAARWAETLQRAWSARDPDTFLELYAADATYRTALGEPESAREHMRRSLLLGDGEPEVWVGAPVVDGDRAVVEWRAALMIDGAPMTFAGAAFLRFSADGLVVDELDYWRSAHAPA